MGGAGTSLEVWALWRRLMTNQLPCRSSKGILGTPYFASPYTILCALAVLVPSFHPSLCCSILCRDSRWVEGHLEANKKINPSGIERASFRSMWKRAASATGSIPTVGRFFFFIIIFLIAFYLYFGVTIVLFFLLDLCLILTFRVF